MVVKHRSFIWLGIVLLIAMAAPALAQQAGGQQAGTVASLRPLAGLSTVASATTAPTETAPAEAMQKDAAAEVPPVKPAGKGTLTIKGFISATFFAQDQSFAFGNGQNAEWPTTDNTENKWFNGGDVRNTRVTLDFSGPELADGWKIGAGLEGDFFGGFNGTGAFSQQQDTPRLRLAYADLVKGGTRLRIGQFWSPLFGEVPDSLSHIAFPLGYGSAGMVGWRFPGVFLYQDLSAAGAKTKTQLDLAVFQGSWNGPGSPLEHLSAGNVSFRNQLEAKINFSGKAAGGAWKIYAAGHWDSKDLSGVGDIVPTAHPKTLTGTAAELGGSYTIGGFLIHGNVYTGKAIGQQFGAITQFGDIKDTGGWLQLGYHIDKRWSVYGFYGMANPNDKEVLDWVGPTGRAKNQQAVGMIEWSLGQYRLGLEYLHDKLTLVNNTDLTGNEVAFSAMYVF
jgi:hypothetical protein